MAPMKRQKAHARRANERSVIARELWDRLPVRYPRNIIWEWW
jgi:hypothetical protein